MTTSRRPAGRPVIPCYPWIPPDVPWESSIAPRGAGIHWDAIRAPTYLSNPAIELLGDQCGAIIADTRGSVHYWLVPVGTATTWQLHHTRACGETQYIAVPSTRHREGPGPHWLRLPGADGYTTDAALLHAALSACLHAQFGPREEAAR